MTHPLWQRLFRRLSARAHLSSAARPHRTRPSLEQLEERINPAVTLTAANTTDLINDINTLNATGGGTINLVANTTYTLTKADTADNSFWYGPAALPPIASTITINGITGDVINASAATAANPFRIFYVSGGLSGELGLGTLTLNHLELVGGVAEGGSSGTGGGGLGAGGAIFNQGTLTLNGVTVTGAEALGGSSGIAGTGGGGMGGNANGSTGGGFGGNLSASGTVVFGGTGAAGGVGLGGGGGGGFQNTDNAVPSGGLAGGAGAGKGGFGGAGGVNTKGTAGGAAGDGGGGGATNTKLLVGGNGGNFGAGGTAGTGGGGGGGVGGGGASGTGGGGGGGGFGGGGGAATTANTGAGNGGFGGGGGGGAFATDKAGLGGFGGGIGSVGGAALGGGGAGLGGAIFNMGASTVTGSGVLNLINTTLTGNTAEGGAGFQGGAGFGGGVFNLGGTATLTYATIANNTVLAGTSTGTKAGLADGGAVYNLAAGNIIQTKGAVTATLIVQNTILAGTPVVGVHDVVNDAAIGGTNNAGNNTVFTGFTSLTQNGIINAGAGVHNVVGTPITVIGNPLLTPLGNFGGPVPTMALMPGSPAIMAGTGSVPGLPTVDARGVPRPAVAPDIGAFQTATETATPDVIIPSIEDFYSPFQQKEVVRVQVNFDGMPVTTGLVSITDNGQTQIVGLDNKGDAVATFLFPVGQEVPGPHPVSATYIPVGTQEMTGPGGQAEFFHFLTASASATAPSTFSAWLFEALFDLSLLLAVPG